jgi:hypothetical protein
LQPISHYSIAFLINEGLQAAGVSVNRKGIIWGSVLPDIDYLLVPFTSRFLAHRTVTHTPLWTVMIAAAMQQRWGFWSTWLGGLVHLAADELTSCNRRTGQRSRLMWRFPYGLDRRPWRRCLFDMGRFPGNPLLSVLLVEGSIISLAVLLAWRKGWRTH